MAEAPLAPEGLIACTECDALYRDVEPEFGQRVVCARCGAVLLTPRRKAGMRILMLSATMLILIAGAAFFPFLRIDAGGLSNSASLLDAAFVFSGPRLALLAIAVLGVILVAPIARMLLLLYVLGPIVFDRPPAAGAAAAYRLSERLRPWAMAEIFALGCAVSLVKIGALADIRFGPGFWMFVVLVLAVLAQDLLICRLSIWRSLDPQTRS